MEARKIGLIVEGQSELIFIRNILFHLFDPSLISFECLHLRANELHPSNYEYNNETAQIHFLILNVENDEKVLSFIKDNEVNFFSKGYEQIIGLRDLFCERYDTLSSGRIDPDINKLVIDSCNDIVNSMSNSASIEIYFSVMELESWWLSMATIFHKVDPALTIEFIHSQLGVNLAEDDIENKIYKPSSLLHRIMSLVGKQYNKHLSEVESITSVITKEDINLCVDHGCESFNAFHAKLVSLK